jgi:hypothetical protein
MPEKKRGGGASEYSQAEPIVEHQRAISLSDTFHFYSIAPVGARQTFAPRIQFITMINWTRRIPGRAYRKCGSLSELTSEPELVRELTLYGPSWTTPSHSFDDCSAILPKCVGLVHFRIGWLDWTKLPEELALLPSLEKVTSLNVTISEFPYHLSACPRLAQLVIRGGDLCSVTDEIFGFRALRHLDLANQPLATIPPDMKARLGLRFLQLHDTPVLQSIPQSAHDSPRPLTAGT